MKILKHLIRVFLRDPLRSGTLLRTLGGLPRFLLQWRSYSTSSGERVPAGVLFPRLGDATVTTPFDPHYFYQSAWAAGCLAEQSPARHVDVGSQVNLIAALTGYLDIEFVDIRLLDVSLRRLTSKKGSILELPYPDNSVKSLSSLHVIEHIGLGRYGDPLDPDGTRKACKELQRVLAKGGHLYLSTPVGEERVEFNAHRVHRAESIVAMFDLCDLAGFALVDDRGQFHPSARPEEGGALSYGCGMFHFTKRPDR